MKVLKGWLPTAALVAVILSGTTIARANGTIFGLTGDGPQTCTVNSNSETTKSGTIFGLGGTIFGFTGTIFGFTGTIFGFTDTSKSGTIFGASDSGNCGGK